MRLPSRCIVIVIVIVIIIITIVIVVIIVAILPYTKMPDTDEITFQVTDQ